MPRGRPSSYNQRLAQDICTRIAGGTSLRAICEDEKFPDRATVFRWLLSHKDFCDQYEQAREWQAQTLVDEITYIADTPVEGTVTRHLGDGRKEVRVADMTEHRKLQVDARKWVAARLLPKKYGDKIEQTHRGDADHPITYAISPNASKW